MKGHHLVRPGKADEGGPHGFSYVLVKLVGRDPPDVVGLEDLVQVTHFGSAQCSRPVGIPGPNLSVTEPRQYEGRGQHQSGWTVGAERRTRRWPRRPTSMPCPTGSAGPGRAAVDLALTGRGSTGRGPVRDRSATAFGSRITFAIASRSSARSCSGVGGSRTTSQPRGATSRAACFSHRSYVFGS